MKLKDHLIRIALIFVGLLIPSAIYTASIFSGHMLGGFWVWVLYAPFVYFIYCVYTGKIGPKLPPKPTNNSVPVTPEMLAYTAAKVDELAPQKAAHEKQLEEIAIYRHDLMEDYAQGKISEAEFEEAYDLIFQMESEAGISSLDFLETDYDSIYRNISDRKK